MKIADIKMGKRVRVDIGDLAKLCRSIEEVGLLHPVVVTTDCDLVAGRRRIAAFKKLGRDDIPAVVAKNLADALLLLKAERDENTCRKDFTPAEAVAVGERIGKLLKPEAAKRKREGQKSGGRGKKKLSPNLGESNGRHARETTAQEAEAGGMKRSTYAKAKKVVEAAKADPKRFKAVVAEMNRTSNVDRAYREVQRAEREEKRREAAKEAAKAATARGAPQTWEVVLGDCVVELAKLDRRPRLIFADPPYNINVEYGEGHNDKLLSEKYLAWVGQWVAESARVLADDGSMWVLINDESAAEFGVLLKRSGLTIRNWVKWYETFGVNCSDKFNRCSRHLFYCVKNPKKFVFHPDAVSRPSDRQTKYNDARANPDGKILDDVWFDIPRLTGTAKERIPGFPTQLPLALLRRIVGCASSPGDLVLDPFSGSATTGVAAVKLGRRYLGIERSKQFAQLSRLRLKGV